MARGSKKFLDTKQLRFLKNYLDPKSKFFGNAYRSALEAGYKDGYAKNITHEMPDWLLENLEDTRKLRKAEKNLEEVQNLPIKDEKGNIDINIVDKRTKVDIFIAKTLGKHKYSERMEHTGKDGESLKIVFDKSFEEE